MTRVEVYLDVADGSGQTGGPVLVGHAFFTRSRAGVTTTFAYDPTYLNAKWGSSSPITSPATYTEQTHPDPNYTLEWQELHVTDSTAFRKT